MAVFKDIEEAKDFFKGDRFAMVNGMQLDEIYEGGCVCSCRISDDHRNALGGVMGGVIFTLADFAFAAASNNDHKPTVSMDSDIRFLASTRGSVLTARASLVKSGRTASVFTVTVTDELGKEIALYTGTGCKL